MIISFIIIKNKYFSYFIKIICTYIKLECFSKICKSKLQREFKYIYKAITLGIPFTCMKLINAALIIIFMSATQ